MVRMKIRTQIIISIIVSVLVISVVGTILFFNYQQLAVASENERLADDIIQGSYALSNLQNDYLLHSSDRSRIQWEEKYNTLQDEFTRLRITDPVQQATLENILESDRQLLDIFSRIIAPRETTGSANGAPADPELTQIRWSRLGVQTQGMIFDASRLSGLIKADTSRIQQANNWLIVFMISALLLVILLNYFIVNRHVLRSLDSLQKGTGIIGSGNLDYSLDESSKDELGDLSRAFNRMTVNLKAVTASRADLEKEVADRKRAEEELNIVSLYTRSLIEANLDPLVTISPEGKITDVNEATIKATGVSRDTLIGSDFSAYFTEPDKASAGYRKVLADGSVRDYPLTLRHTSGRTIEVLYNGSVYRNAKGELQGVFAAARDITDRKRAEEELARSNKELQQFAYVSSHDLQEPLRMISSFVQLLEKRYKGKLDQDADEFIGFVVEGTSRMQRMIQDLLTFSRVQSRGVEFAPVDTNQVFEKTVFSHQIMIKEAGAVVTKDELPTVMGDETQLSQLFQNLIDNAIKFRRAEETPKVHISAQRKGNDWEFSVQDNGIGIDPQYFDRIFIIFQRLHAREAYEGTGIGLAVCMRIVERHGGRIWVESEPGRGSIFHFSLPAVK